VFGGNSKKEWFVRSRLAIKTHAFLERWFPERRVFLRSEVDTRFIRLRPHVQLIGFTGTALVMAWSIIATSVLLMDSIGAGNFREQAKRDQRMYEERLNFLSSDRDARAAEALAAQQRFNSALEQISLMQSQLLASETRRRELETGIEVIQSTLRRTMKERDALGAELAQVQSEGDNQNGASTGLAALPVAEDTLGLVVEALANTAAERDQIRTNAATALVDVETMAQKIISMQEQNEAIFRQLEEAMAISVAPLDSMFRKAGMNTDTLIEQVKRGYSGQGGPLTPIALSTRGEVPSEAAERANRLLDQMDRLNLYRIAAQAAPFAIPVKSSYRFTSGYGYRRDPKTGGRRMHSGVDFAGPVGTPLYATADGVVTHAGWLSGYGRLVKIKHEFGIETRYAHMSA
jgi:murein DD-endopeptidase MepM/ murein hydrolase activator NlpD